MEHHVEHPDEAAWAAYVEGTLGEVARERLGLHLDLCAECAGLVVQVMELGALEELGRLSGPSARSHAVLFRILAACGAAASQTRWSAKFEVRPSAPAGPSSHLAPLPFSFLQPPNAASSLPSAQLAAEGDRLVFTCPDQGEGTVQITWLGRTASADVGADGRGSVPLSAFDVQAAGGAMGGRAAAWHAGGAEQHLTVEFFPRSSADDVMRGGDGVTKHSEAGDSPAPEHPVIDPLIHPTHIDDLPAQPTHDDSASYPPSRDTADADDQRPGGMHGFPAHGQALDDTGHPPDHDGGPHV